MTALTAEMTVAQIVLDHSECAGVFQRHRIDYCCKGEQPLASACAQRGADAKQVLEELEEVVRARKSAPELDARALPTEALVEHVVQRYHRALRDALWHNSLTVTHALGVDVDSMQVAVTIGVPRPETVDKAQVLAVLPHGTGTVTVVEGGLEIPNEAGTGSTLMAHAAAEVFLDIDENGRPAR